MILESGIIWYYPGYADACQMFDYVIDVYDWTSLRMNPYNNRLQTNYGGGSQFYTFEEILQNVKLWR